MGFFYIKDAPSRIFYRGRNFYPKIIFSKSLNDSLHFMYLKKRVPNPAFRGGITVCDDKNGLRPRTVTWLVPLYSPDLGAPSEYLSCHVLTLGKFFRVV